MGNENINTSENIDWERRGMLTTLHGSAATSETSVIPSVPEALSPAMGHSIPSVACLASDSSQDVGQDRTDLTPFHIPHTSQKAG